MLKTVKNGSGIRVDPPPCFFKIPTFSRFFWGGAFLKQLYIHLPYMVTPMSNNFLQAVQSQGCNITS